MSDVLMAAGWHPLWVYALHAVCPAVFEELIFRGYVTARLDALLSPRESLVVQSVLFSVFHLAVASFPSHFVIGLVLGLLRRRTKSLCPGMAVHGAWNALVISAELALRPRSTPDAGSSRKLSFRHQNACRQRAVHGPLAPMLVQGEAGSDGGEAMGLAACSQQSTRAAYLKFAPFVRRSLRNLGVEASDVPDLCHEVFVVMHTKTSSLAIANLGAWLKAISRRIAAGYRRKLHRHRQSLYENPVIAFSPSASMSSPLEAHDHRKTVRSALAALDEDARDLLALHDVGEIPLTRLADLDGRDRKTVRKRLESARHSVALFLERDIRSSRPPTIASPPTRRRPAMRLSDPAGAARLRMELVGNVLVTIWPRDITVASVDDMIRRGRRFIEGGNGAAAYLAVVEATTLPPSLASRKRIVEALTSLGPGCRATSMALLGDAGDVVGPIIRGLLLLTDASFPSPFFDEIELASSWICRHLPQTSTGEPMTPDALTRFVHALRG